MMKQLSQRLDSDRLTKSLVEDYDGLEFTETEQTSIFHRMESPTIFHYLKSLNF